MTKLTSCSKYNIWAHKTSITFKTIHYKTIKGSVFARGVNKIVLNSSPKIFQHQLIRKVYLSFLLKKPKSQVKLLALQINRTSV